MPQWCFGLTRLLSVRAIDAIQNVKNCPYTYYACACYRAVSLRVSMYACVCDTRFLVLFFLSCFLSAAWMVVGIARYSIDDITISWPEEIQCKTSRYKKSLFNIQHIRIIILMHFLVESSIVCLAAPLNRRTFVAQTFLATTATCTAASAAETIGKEQDCNDATCLGGKYL